MVHRASVPLAGIFAVVLWAVACGSSPDGYHIAGQGTQDVTIELSTGCYALSFAARDIFRGDAEAAEVSFYGSDGGRVVSTGPSDDLCVGERGDLKDGEVATKVVAGGFDTEWVLRIRSQTGEGTLREMVALDATPPEYDYLTYFNWCAGLADRFVPSGISPGSIRASASSAGNAHLLPLLADADLLTEMRDAWQDAPLVPSRLATYHENRERVLALFSEMANAVAAADLDDASADETDDVIAPYSGKRLDVFGDWQLTRQIDEASRASEACGADVLYRNR